MFVNVIGDYRKNYIKDRRKGIDPESAHKEALESVYLSLLHASAVNKLPISDRDLMYIKELNSSPYYTQLLEDMIKLPEEDQKEYLRQAAKIPQLRLVK